MSNLNEYWTENDPDISETTRSILTKYSGVPEDQLVKHIRDIRQRAWEVFQYPCIGAYNFLDFSIGDAVIYDDVVQKVKNGATLLDLGCCFGQDIRKLVFDGCPSENLVGSELEAPFIDFGYDLFQDRSKLKVSFKPGDFFAPDMAGLKGESFDFIHSGSFFHLFTWDEQVEAISKAVGLLKRKPGSAIFGRQAGVDEPGPFEALKARSGPMYMHNEESFKKLMREVEEKTEVRLEVETNVVGRWHGNLKGGWKVLSFTARYIE